MGLEPGLGFHTVDIAIEARHQLQREPEIDNR